MVKLITQLNFHYIYRTMYISAVVQINMAKHFFFFFRKKTIIVLKNQPGSAKSTSQKCGGISSTHTDKPLTCLACLWSVWKFRDGREQRGVEQWGGEQRRIIALYLVWMFLKLVRGKGVITHFSCLDVLKIRRESKGNDLNRQIYPYFRIDLQHCSMINLLN